MFSQTQVQIGKYTLPMRSQKPSKPQNNRIQIQTFTGRPNRPIDFTGYNEATIKAKAKNVSNFCWFINKIVCIKTRVILSIK